MTQSSIFRARAINSKIRPVKKAAISDEIVDQIIALIAKGDLTPGQRLPSERELCKTFGAGRSSLREALRCLSIVGVLNVRVGEGTSVAVDGGRFLGKLVGWRLITEQHDIENLLEVRVALEGLAAASAASVRSDEVVALLEDIVAKMEASLGNEKRFGAFDLEFHVAIGKASGNALLFDLVSMIRGQLVSALSKILGLPYAQPLTLKEHAAILQAIKRGDPDRAREAMQAHLLAALDRFRQSMAIEDSASKQSNVPSSLARASRKKRSLPKT